MSKTSQRLAGLQLQAQQPHLTVKADVKEDIKTRARKEDVAANEKFGDISSAWVDDNPMSQTSFGDSTEPSAPEYIYKYIAVTLWSTKAPKRQSCVSEGVRTTTPAGGPLHAGSASTTPRTIFPPTSSLELR